MANKEVTIANDMFKELLNPFRYKLVYGGRAGGKSQSIATIFLLIAMETPQRILCTREVQNTIKESVHHLLRDLINKYKWNSFYKVTDTNIIGRNGSEFIFKGLKSHIVHNVKSIEGVDKCWIEEGQTVSKYSLEILDPSIRKAGSEIWISFNRFFDNDPVWERYMKVKRPRTCIIKTNYYDVDPKLITKEVLELAETDKKLNYEDYLHIWEGEPKNDTEKTWLPREMLQDAINRQDVDQSGKYIVGVDMARFGGDRIVFFMRKGMKVLDYKVMVKKDSIEVSNELEAFIKHKSLTIINIDDSGGWASGVIDILGKQRGYYINEVKFGDPAEDGDKYFNAISEMWGDFKTILDKISIPDYPELIQELNGRYYGFDKRTYKFRIEPKDDYKKRFIKSPDLADALLLCFKGAGTGAVDYDSILEDNADLPERESLGI